MTSNNREYVLKIVIVYFDTFKKFSAFWEKLTVSLIIPLVKLPAEFYFRNSERKLRIWKTQPVPGSSNIENPLKNFLESFYRLLSAFTELKYIVIFFKEKGMTFWRFSILIVMPTYNWVIAFWWFSIVFLL